MPRRPGPEVLREGICGGTNAVASVTGLDPSPYAVDGSGTFVLGTPTAGTPAALAVCWGSAPSTVAEYGHAPQPKTC